MSNLLKQHQKNEVRYKSKSFTLYNPTEFQREELTQIVMDNSKIEDDKLTAEYGISMIRYIFKELTNVGAEVDELSDEELGSLLDNSDRELELLIREFTALLEEISEDVVYSITKQVKMMSDMINTLDVNGDTEKLGKKWDKFSKKYKLNMSWQDLMSNTEKQQELLKELSKEVK